MKHLLIAWLSCLLMVGPSSAAVDANSASKDALQTVRGIGPSTAERIVAERRKGPYKDLADLQARVKGIGESKMRKMIADGLSVSKASAAGSDARMNNRGAANAPGTAAESGARRSEPAVQRFQGGRAAPSDATRR